MYQWVNKLTVKAAAFFLLVMFLCSCGQNPAVNSAPETTPTMSTEQVLPTETVSPTATAEATTAVTATATPSPLILPDEHTIVDGYDITAATYGTKLKDAFSGLFSIGCGINGSAVGNSTVRSAAMSEIFTYHFNSATFSNLMKASYLLNQSESINNYKNGIETPAVNFKTVYEGLEFCKENGIKMRGHVLIWHTQVPEWFFREGYETNASYVTREVMLMRMESYIKQVLEYTDTNYPGVIYCWDVVNEAIETSKGSYELESGYNIRTKFDGKDNLWYTVVGVDYVEKAFEFARKYAGDGVKLFYNDYNTFQEAKREKIYLLVSDLADKGLIDGIGMQSYMSLTYPSISGKADSVKTAITRFAQLGLEIHLTELTISCDEPTETNFIKQAARYKELFNVLLELDSDNGGAANITNVTFFGLMDQYLFYKDNTDYSRLFDGQLQPKPDFYSILQCVE